MKHPKTSKAEFRKEECSQYWVVEKIKCGPLAIVRHLWCVGCVCVWGEAVEEGDGFMKDLQRIGRSNGRRLKRRYSPESMLQIWCLSQRTLSLWERQLRGKKKNVMSQVFFPAKLLSFLQILRPNSWLGRDGVFCAGDTGITCHRVALAGVG